MNASKLITVASIREVFNQLRGELAWHALGVQARKFADPSDKESFPVAPATFRTFLLGRGLPTKVKGLLPYFAALGASPEDCAIIENTLENEVKYRRAMLKDSAEAKKITQKASQSPVVDFAAECTNVVASIGEVIGMPISLSAEAYSRGTDGRSGILRYLNELEPKMKGGFMRSSLSNDPGFTAVQLINVTTIYLKFLMDNPDFALMVLGPRTFVLCTNADRAEATTVEGKIRKCSYYVDQAMMTIVGDTLNSVSKHTYENEVVEGAVECGAVRVIGLAHEFYTNFVIGAQGTCAMYRTACDYRSTLQPGQAGHLNAFQELKLGFEQKVHEAIQLGSTQPQSEYRAIYRKHYESKEVQDNLRAIWIRDYVPDLLFAGVLRAIRYVREYSKYEVDYARATQILDSRYVKSVRGWDAAAVWPQNSNTGQSAVRRSAS